VLLDYDLQPLFLLEGENQVDHYGSVRQAPHHANLLAQNVQRHVGRAQGAQAASLRHSDRKSRVTHPAD
jgi:hypothetical protein